MNSNAAQTKFSNVIEAHDQWCGDLINGEGHQTVIASNGSRWAGESHATIEELLSVLDSHPLDLRFCEFGGFVDVCPVSATDRVPLFPEGFEKFHGNFLTVSHVFEIVSNDPQVLSALRGAIKKNLSRQQASSFTS